MSWPAGGVYEPETDTIVTVSSSTVYLRKVGSDMKIAQIGSAGIGSSIDQKVAALYKSGRIYVLGGTGTVLSTLRLASVNPDATEPQTAVAFDKTDWVPSGWTLANTTVLATSRFQGKFVILLADKYFSSSKNVAANSTVTPCALVVADVDDIENPERVIPVTVTANAATNLIVNKASSVILNNGESVFSINLKYSDTKTLYRVIDIKDLVSLPASIDFTVDTAKTSYGIDVGTTHVVKNKVGYLYGTTITGSGATIRITSVNNLDTLSGKKNITGAPVRSLVDHPISIQPDSINTASMYVGCAPLSAAYGSTDVIIPCAVAAASNSTFAGRLSVAFKYPEYPTPYVSGDLYTYIKAK